MVFKEEKRNIKFNCPLELTMDIVKGKWQMAMCYFMAFEIRSIKVWTITT